MSFLCFVYGRNMVEEMKEEEEKAIEEL